MDGNLLVNSTFISSFKINKVNNLPSLTVFFCFFFVSLIFLPSLSITFVVTFQAKLINKSSKLSVGKGIASLLLFLLPNLFLIFPIIPNIPQGNPPD